MIRWWWRRTLVDVLRKDISRTDDLRPPPVRLAERCYPIIHSSLN